MNQKGVRRPNIQAPVVNKQGQVIGHVTSCSIDREGYLLGLAIVDLRFAREDAPVGIFVLPERSQSEKQKTELGMGDRVMLHADATILSRFPEKEGD